VSLVDLVATMIDAAGAPVAGPLAGESLLSLAQGNTLPTPWKDEVFAAYLAHGVDRPLVMLRRGRSKLMESLDEPPELYELEDDPGELHNLADDPAHAPVVERLRQRLPADWEPRVIERQVRQSQRERLLIASAETGIRAEDARARWYATGSTVPPARP